MKKMDFVHKDENDHYTYFDCPTQVLWRDYDAEEDRPHDKPVWCGGIAFQNYIICACCGGIMTLNDIYENACAYIPDDSPNDSTEPIQILPGGWYDLNAMFVE